MTFQMDWLRYGAFFIVMVLVGLIVSIAINPDSANEALESSQPPLAINPLAKTAPNGAALPAISPEDTVITYRFNDGDDIISSTVRIDVEGGVEFIFEDIGGQTKIRQFDDDRSYLYDTITRKWQEIDSALQGDLLPDISLIIGQEQIDSFNAVAIFEGTQGCNGLSCSAWEAGGEDAGAVYRVINLTKKIYDFTSIDENGDLIAASFDYQQVDINLADMELL
jgi:hypothetical protein